MNVENVFVVPKPDTDQDSGLQEDCRLVTQLLRRVLREQPSLTLPEAFAVLKWKVMRICLFDWDSMEPIEID